MITQYRDELQKIKEKLEKTGKSRSYQLHSGKVRTISWSSDGSKLATGTHDKSIFLFACSNSSLRELNSKEKAHNDSVDQVSFAPKNCSMGSEILASTGPDKTVHFWDVRSLITKPVGTVTCSDMNINLSWAFDGTKLAVGSSSYSDESISVIDVRKLAIVKDQTFKHMINEFTWTPDGKYIIVTSSYGKLIVLSAVDLKVLFELPAHSVCCTSLTFDPSGKMFAVGSNDAITTIWDYENFIPISSATKLEWAVKSVSFSYDSTMLASGSEDLFIDLSHVATGISLGEIPVKNITCALSCSPNAPVIAYASDDKEYAVTLYTYNSV